MGLIDWQLAEVRWSSGRLSSVVAEVPHRVKGAAAERALAAGFRAWTDPAVSPEYAGPGRLFLIGPGLLDEHYPMELLRAQLDQLAEEAAQEPPEDSSMLEAVRRRVAGL